MEEQSQRQRKNSQEENHQRALGVNNLSTYTLRILSPLIPFILKEMTDGTKVRNSGELVEGSSILVRTDRPQDKYKGSNSWTVAVGLRSWADGT